MSDKANNSIWGNLNARTEGPDTGTPGRSWGASEHSLFLLDLTFCPGTGQGPGSGTRPCLPTKAVQVTQPERTAGTRS